MVEPFEDQTLERLPHQLTDNPIIDETISFQLHRARYEFAARFARGRVYDVACGSGYGTALLARNIDATVVGVDRCEKTIANAVRRYQWPNLSFECLDAYSLSQFPPADVIVSLETIEHMPLEPSHLIRVFESLLDPEGTLVLSVPIGPTRDANPYHLHDFNEPSLMALVFDRFRIVDRLDQIQDFNPVRLLKGNNPRFRIDRMHLVRYYRTHPTAIWKRFSYTLREGFCVRYLTLALSRK